MTNEHLTITLTGRPPVKIDKEKWPVVASAKDWDNTYECQANRTWKLTVRQHEDGRAVVYGVYTTQYQNGHDLRGGELLAAGADIPAATLRIANSLNFDERIANECIADLPAVEI